MASENTPLHTTLIETHNPSSKSHLFSRRKLLRRRRKVPSVRLGGGRSEAKRGFSLVRLLRRIKLRWLKLQYYCMLKRLKDYYYSVVQDLIEAGATLHTIQQRIMTESHSAVPVMGVAMAVAVPSKIEPRQARTNRKRLKS